jgi:hypothetical protein
MLCALNRYGKVSTRSFLWVALGVFLFVISDSLLAINKFAHSIDGVHLWVISTLRSALHSIIRKGWLYKQSLVLNAL